MFRKLQHAITPMIIVFIIHTILIFTIDIYYIFPDFDIIMHGAGGIATAWAIWNLFNIYKEKHDIVIRPKLVMMLFLIGTTAIVGIAWEFFELAHDIFFQNITYQVSIADTVGDLLMDLAGAFLLSLIIRKRL